MAEKKLDFSNGLDIDFKMTIWERINVAPEKAEKVFQALKGGEIKTSNELYDFLKEETEHLNTEFLLETEEYLTPETNNGEPTIDVMLDGNTIYQNI